MCISNDKQVYNRRGLYLKLSPIKFRLDIRPNDSDYFQITSEERKFCWSCRDEPLNDILFKYFSLRFRLLICLIICVWTIYQVPTLYWHYVIAIKNNFVITRFLRDYRENIFFSRDECMTIIAYRRVHHKSVSSKSTHCIKFHSKLSLKLFLFIFINY